MSTRTITIPLQSSQTGLTLAAQLVDATGVNSGAAVTTGFAELGNGHYLWTYASFPTQFRGAVKFTSAGAVVASLAVNPEEAENVDATVSSRQASGTVSADIVSILGSAPAAQNLHDDELAAAPTIPTATDNATAVWGATTRTLSAFGFMVTLADASVTSAKFTVGTVNAAAAGLLERLTLLFYRFFPASGGSVTLPKSGNGNLVVKGAGGATLSTQPTTDDGTNQSLGAAS